MGCCPHLQTRAQGCPHIRKAGKLKEEEATLTVKELTISLCPRLWDAAFRQQSPSAWVPDPSHVLVRLGRAHHRGVDGEVVINRKHR